MQKQQKYRSHIKIIDVKLILFELYSGHSTNKASRSQIHINNAFKFTLKTKSILNISLLKDRFKGKEMIFM